MKFAAAGDRAVLVTFDGAPPAVVPDLPHMLACITGHESLLIICDEPPDREELAAWLERAGEGAGLQTTSHRFDVGFDGVDLDKLLAHVHLPRDEFLSRVRDVRLTVRYLGFRPGFAYCDGWPAAWRMPRRVTSRNRVPRGTFAMAGAMAGFYPEDSPGGWNLLGTTDAPLWDPEREPPNLLKPGDVIEIHPVEHLPSPPHPASGHLLPRAAGEKAEAEVVAEVLAPGQLTTIVGPRNWKLASAGVTPGGPFDGAAAALANRAVGNADDAPLLECVFVAPTLKLHRQAAFCDGALNVRELRDGEAIGRIPNGMRGYLAIAEGVGGEGLVRKGDLLRAGHDVAKLSGEIVALQARHDATSIRIILGPHAGPPLPTEWEVTNQLNRVGIRLRPLEPVTATLPADLPSCGMQFGTLQWHPDGSLIAMGPDHPVTGGYLQPATVVSSDLWKLAQAAPGMRIHLILSREDGEGSGGS